MSVGHIQYSLPSSSLLFCFVLLELSQVFFAPPLNETFLVRLEEPQIGKYQKFCFSYLNLLPEADQTDFTIHPGLSVFKYFKYAITLLAPPLGCVNKFKMSTNKNIRQTFNVLELLVALNQKLGLNFNALCSIAIHC